MYFVLFKQGALKITKNKPSFSFPVVWPSHLWHSRNPESSPSPNMTTSRPSWTSPSLGTWVWVHSGNYKRVSSTIVPQSYCECVFLFCFFTGSGAAAKFQPSQTAQLPLLLVPRGGRQWLQSEQRWSVGLQSWLHWKGGDGQCAWQRQAFPPQPQAEVCRGSLGADGTVHVVWTTRLVGKTSGFKHIQA